MLSPPRAPTSSSAACSPRSRVVAGQGGDRRLQQVACLGVVEGDEGDVVWHPGPDPSELAQRAVGERVAGGDDRGGRLGKLHQLPDGVLGAVRRPLVVAGDQVLRRHREPQRAHPELERLEAFDGRTVVEPRRLRRRPKRRPEIGDPLLVVDLHQVFQERLHTAGIVDGGVAEPDSGEHVVDENHRGVTSHEAARGRHEQAVHVAGMERAEGGMLARLGARCSSPAPGSRRPPARSGRP